MVDDAVESLPSRVRWFAGKDSGLEKRMIPSRGRDGDAQPLFCFPYMLPSRKKEKKRKLTTIARAKGELSVLSGDDGDPHPHHCVPLFWNTPSLNLLDRWLNGRRLVDHLKGCVPFPN
ncbi:hypothetical protein CPSG_03224 [Coccidioides posadasii str. Silveira]|uniref:Uncharacterized protein n=1 Tax=Coccidioides posadasii (strain RMSCC 757 / Silveira) TaxID=443226 RepID=E9D145_COCPS|nr:hypothetical protein CPSG_03224 [Coccidioides posadasii str. Silveira]